MTRGLLLLACLGLSAAFLSVGGSARAGAALHMFPSVLGTVGGTWTGSAPNTGMARLHLVDAGIGGGNGPSAGAPAGQAVVGGEEAAPAEIRKPEGEAPHPAIPDAARTPDGQPEVVITGSAIEVGRIAALAPRIGLTPLRQRTLERLGLSMLVVRKPAWQSIDALRDRLRNEGLSVTADYNALYRPAGDARAYASEMVTPRHVAACRLDRPIRIGVVDGTVNLDSAALRGVAVVTDSPSTIGTGRASDHATDVISLIAAQPGNGRVAGLLPQAQIFAAAAVRTHEGRQSASVDDIARALDWMARSRVAVVNMSLTGPANGVLQAVIGRVAQLGTIMVAAVGNDQQGTVAYPASDPNVIGVTAVDALKRRYAKANYGPDVDFAAPGVDVYLPAEDGYAYRSGTSYASAVATAVVALEIADGPHGPDAIAKSLAGNAEDLGAPGRDRLFGWGLIRGKNCKPF